MGCSDASILTPQNVVLGSRSDREPCSGETTVVGNHCFYSKFDRIEMSTNTVIILSKHVIASNTLVENSYVGK